MSRKLEWNEHGQSVNTKGDPDGKFVISSVVQVSGEQAGRTEWFLSEGPLDQAPAPCDSREEAEALAQAITKGSAALRDFEGNRMAARREATAERRRAARREEYAKLLEDPELVALFKAKLGAD